MINPKQNKMMAEGSDDDMAEEMQDTNLEKSYEGLNKVELAEDQFPDSEIGDTVKTSIEGVIEEKEDGSRCIKITSLDGQEIGGGNEDQKALDDVTKQMRSKLQEKSAEMNSYKNIPEEA